MKHKIRDFRIVIQGDIFSNEISLTAELFRDDQWVEDIGMSSSLERFDSTVGSFLRKIQKKIKDGL